MIWSGVDTKLALDLAAKLVFGQHANDGFLYDAVGVLLHQLANGAFAQAAGIPRVAVNHLMLYFIAADGDLVGVDHDDKVTAINIRSERGLVLAAQQSGRYSGKAAKHHVRGVDDVPRTRGVTRLGRVCRHSAYLPLSFRFLPGSWIPGITRVPVKKPWLIQGGVVLGDRH